VSKIERVLYLQEDYCNKGNRRQLHLIWHLYYILCTLIHAFVQGLNQLEVYQGHIVVAEHEKLQIRLVGKVEKEKIID